MAKAAFKKKKKKKKKTTLGRFYLNLRKKPIKCHIWSIALYGAEAWKIRRVDRKYQSIFEMWSW